MVHRSAGIGGGSGSGGNGSITISGDKTIMEATGGGDAKAWQCRYRRRFQWSTQYNNVNRSSITIEARLSPALRYRFGGGAAGIGGGNSCNDDKRLEMVNIYIPAAARHRQPECGIGGGFSGRYGNVGRAVTSPSREAGYLARR